LTIDIKTLIFILNNKHNNMKMNEKG
jgi:hypothetical protein